MKMGKLLPMAVYPFTIMLLHSEWPKLHRLFAILSATGLSFLKYHYHTLSKRWFAMFESQQVYLKF